MIYFCADDFGVHEGASARIMHLVDLGVINKVSVFPNFDSVDLRKISENKDVMISLHLNLVEGRCMAEPFKEGLIADKNGNFKHSFIGLFKLYLFNRKAFEKEVYKEIKAQVFYWKSIMPKDMPFSIDSHQHTHMIPGVFRALIKVLREEKIEPEYMRIPAEPILPFIKTPSLYFTYAPVNLIKQWLLSFLWLINKKEAKKINIKKSLFFGILFSGRMDEKRVNKILPKYTKVAEKEKKDIEVLFHPGYLKEKEENLSDKNIVFDKFYFSENRKTEFDSVIKISERSVD